MNLVLALVAMLSFSITLGCKYAKFGIHHTMCEYSPEGCNFELLHSGVTQRDVDIILSTHNELRNKVATGAEEGQPSASNMLELKWDSELSEIAQRWADQCIFGHDSVRSTDSYSHVGQNTAWLGKSVRDDGNPDFTAAIDMWYNEVIQPGFDSAFINHFKFNYDTGHYTQLVWATTKRVGCGYTYYNQYNFYKKLYICNYGPGGNIIGASMYEIGSEASACSQGKSRNYTGLCDS